jgi:hypothetical protein
MSGKENNAMKSILKKSSGAISLILSFLSSLFLFGCNNAAMTEKELSKVAKDWCMVIRASQVIPVYPLTEDLQPGDVFLVTMPVQSQHELYSRKGFLPLDYHVKRINVRQDETQNYSHFYKDDYFKAIYDGTALSRTIKDTGQDDPLLHLKGIARAAFPNYTFSVNRDSGVRVAIPVQGIPIGLKYLNTSEATGTIKISNAYTYGVDVFSLVNRLNDIVDRDLLFRKQLRDLYAAHTKECFFTERPRFYLRIVYRVYCTGGVDITLDKKNASYVRGDVGQVQPVTLGDPNSVENYRKTLKLLNEIDTGITDANAISRDTKISDLLRQRLAGGSGVLAGYSSNSVSMHETFDRILVIGYLGIDLPICADGSLGPAIATRELLYNWRNEPQMKLKPPSIQTLLVLKAIYGALKEASKEEDSRAQKIKTDLDDLSKYLPCKYEVNTYEESNNKIIIFKKKDVDVDVTAGFQSVVTYLSILDSSIKILTQFSNEKKGMTVSNNAQGVLCPQQVQEQLDKSRKLRQDILDRLNTSSAISEAIEYWHQLIY